MFYLMDHYRSELNGLSENVIEAGVLIHPGLIRLQRVSNTLRLDVWGIKLLRTHFTTSPTV